MVEGLAPMLKGSAPAIGRARKLRRTLTLPEGLLWRELRKRRQGPRFRRQHPAGPFVLDFACLEAKLAIEIDGEAHDRAGRPGYDEARDAWLANQRYRTLRIPAREVLQDVEAVVTHILTQCQPLHHRATPGGPPPRAGEELA
jgi:very-short-patch-repair endonuclease